MDYTEIKQLSKQLGARVTDLIALAPQNDPFYTGTPNDWALGEWFAGLWRAFGYTSGVHLRRIHYQVVSQDPPVQLPNGLPYENTMECWDLLNLASKAARYLGLVQAGAFVDRRNAEAVVYATRRHFDPGVSVYSYLSKYDFSFPEFPPLPHYRLEGYGAEQAYHLEVWCEKSTMNDILLPLCQQYEANLQIGSGELSITAALSLVSRLQQAERPARIFYVSDFDPAGQSMPVAVSRKVEYFVHALGLDLDVRIFPVVLTAEQVGHYQLPRTPIKETERRRVGFEERYGMGAVELDALEALYPGELARVLGEDLSSYYDHTLQGRVEGAAWEVQAALDLRRDQVLGAYEEDIEVLRQEHEALSAEFTGRMEAYGERVRALWLAMRGEMRLAQPDLSAFPIPQPYASHEIGEGLYNSERDYLGQIAAYKEFQGKALVEG